MERIAEIRKERGWSQVKLGAVADVNPSTVNQIERGMRHPNSTTLEKLADALDVEIADLFGRTEVPKVRPPEQESEESRWLDQTRINAWADHLKMIGGLLQDHEQKHTEEQFAAMSTLHLTTARVYADADPKASATPMQIAHLEEAEGVLRLGMEMLEQRMNESNPNVTSLPKYRERRKEAESLLQGKHVESELA